MTDRLAALHPGTSYHCEALEGPRYAHHFGRLIRPEALDAGALACVRTLVVPCRTHPARLRPHFPLLCAFLAAGGTLVAMGETFQDEWIDGVAFEPCETNYWWWLEPGADLGVRFAKPDHPLLRGMEPRATTWHLHGWYEPPPGAETLLTDAQGRSMLYVDTWSFGGRLVVTSLDPFYHHGSHFMPAATRFLDGFLPNLRAWQDPGAHG